jgi:hypothetical protein
MVQKLHINVQQPLASNFILNHQHSSGTQEPGICSRSSRQGHRQGSIIRVQPNILETPMPSATKYLLSAAFAAATLLLPARAVLADTLIYTFAGVASGTIITSGKSSTSFTSAAFTVSFTENTANITGGGGFFLYNPAPGGVFTEGSYSATFTNAIIETNGNPDSGMGAFETANLFNSTIDNGLTLNSNPNLLNYALNTTVATGTVLAASGDLAPTLNGVGDGFNTSSGDVVEFTGLDALSFTVTKPATAPSSVPEPSTLVLLTAGLSGAGMLRRRFLA